VDAVAGPYSCPFDSFGSFDSTPLECCRRRRVRDLFPSWPEGAGGSHRHLIVDAEGWT